MIKKWEMSRKIAYFSDHVNNHIKGNYSRYNSKWQRWIGCNKTTKTQGGIVYKKHMVNVNVSIC